MKKTIANIFNTIARASAKVAVNLDDRKCGVVKTSAGSDDTGYTSVAEAIKFFTSKGISIKDSAPVVYYSGITVYLDGNDNLDCHDFPVIHTNTACLVRMYNTITRHGTFAIQMISAFGAVFRCQEGHIDVISELTDVCHRHGIYVPAKITIGWLTDLCKATGGYAMLSALLTEINEGRINRTNRCYFCKHAIGEGARGRYRCSRIADVVVEEGLSYDELALYHPDLHISSIDGTLRSSYINGTFAGYHCECFSLRNAALRMAKNNDIFNHPTETKAHEEFVAPKMSNIDVAVSKEEAAKHAIVPTSSSNPG